MDKRCKKGEHILSEHDREIIFKNKTIEYKAKCDNPDCGQYVLLVKDGDMKNEYYIIELGEGI